jgi:hypothetical protein
MTDSARPEFTKSARFKGDDAAYAAAVWDVADKIKNTTDRDGDFYRPLVQNAGLESNHIEAAITYLNAQPKP